MAGMSLNNLTLKWLQMNGATARNLPDAWTQFLDLQSFPPGAMMERRSKWWRDGGVVQRGSSNNDTHSKFLGQRGQLEGAVPDKVYGWLLGQTDGEGTGGDPGIVVPLGWLSKAKAILSSRDIPCGEVIPCPPDGVWYDGEFKVICNKIVLCDEIIPLEPSKDWYDGQGTIICGKTVPCDEVLPFPAWLSLDNKLLCEGIIPCRKVIYSSGG